MFCAAWGVMVSAYQNCLDVFLMQSFELISHKRACRISRQDAIVEVSPYEEEVGLVFEGEVDEYLETSLEVMFSRKPFRSILDCRGVEMVVGSEEHLDCH